MSTAVAQEDLRTIAGKDEERFLSAFFVLYKTARLVDKDNKSFQHQSIKFYETYNCSPVPDLSIKAFCQITSIKQKTLEKAINEYFGISPISLVKALKLNLFRKEIFGSFSSVSDAAQKCGFKHLGQLSADYKKLFGELPRETLKRLELMTNSS